MDVTLSLCPGCWRSGPISPKICRFFWLSLSLSLSLVGTMQSSRHHLVNLCGLTDPGQAIAAMRFRVRGMFRPHLWRRGGGLALFCRIRAPSPIANYIRPPLKMLDGSAGHLLIFFASLCQSYTSRHRFSR